MLDEKLSVGMSDAEIRDLIAVIDQKQKGCIEFSDFENIVGPRLRPQILSAGSCTGVPVSRSIEDEDRPDGRGRQGKFVYDSPVSFNNKFRQTLDENGVPTLKNIFDGAFDKTDRMDVDVPSQDFVPQVHGTGKRWLIPSTQEFAPGRRVPMMQAVMEGNYYGCPVHHSAVTNKTSRDCLRDHRRMIAGYSEVVKAIKPPHRKQTRDRPTSKLDRMTQEYVVPTTASEVCTVYGGSIDTRAATSMAQFLAGASEKEKERYVRTRKKSMAGNAQSSRPATAATGKFSARPQEGRDATGYVLPSRPTSALHVHNNAELGRLGLGNFVPRPMTSQPVDAQRSGQHDALEEATRFMRAAKDATRDAYKPASILSQRPTTVKSEMRRAFSPNHMAYLNSTRKAGAKTPGQKHPDPVGNRMHLDLQVSSSPTSAVRHDTDACFAVFPVSLTLVLFFEQKSAFGAAFAAKRIDCLQKTLLENAAVAAGHTLA